MPITIEYLEFLNELLVPQKWKIQEIFTSDYNNKKSFDFSPNSQWDEYMGRLTVKQVAI
jgi:hypothetical protein